MFVVVVVNEEEEVGWFAHCYCIAGVFMVLSLLTITIMKISNMQRVFCLEKKKEALLTFFGKINYYIRCRLVVLNRLEQSWTNLD